MTVGELVQHLRAQGVSVTALGDRLQVVGPCDDTTVALRAELSWRRTEALELLGSRRSEVSRSPLPPQTRATVQHLPVRQPGALAEAHRFPPCLGVAVLRRCAGVRGAVHSARSPTGLRSWAGRWSHTGG